MVRIMHTITDDTRITFSLHDRKYLFDDAQRPNKAHTCHSYFTLFPLIATLQLRG